jgi:hypothetical protein
MLAPSLGRPPLRFGREGFPQVQILENQSASAKPLRETPSPCDHLQRIRGVRPQVGVGLSRWGRVLGSCFPAVVSDGGRGQGSAGATQKRYGRNWVTFVCLVYLVYFVYLVGLVHLVFAQKRYDRDWADPSEKIWNVTLSNNHLLHQVPPKPPLT